MTVTLRRPTPHSYTPAVAAPLVVSTRPARPDEWPWLIHSWSEGYKDSPRAAKLRWSDYKLACVPRLEEALRRADTRVLVATVDGTDVGVGWIAFARWPSIDAVHWVYTAMPCRRRGVMRALLDAAGLRDRLVHTHLGADRKRRGEKQSVRSDLWIVELLRAAGKIVSHVPYQEWSK